MKYKAIVADVDGTLIKATEKPAPKPTEKLIKAVEVCQGKGVIFTLASARSLNWLDKLIYSLNLSSLVILDNGAKIYDCRNKRYLWKSLLPKSKAQEILSYLGGLNLVNEKTRIFAVDGEERLEDMSKIRKWEISKIVVLGLSSYEAQGLYDKLEDFSDISVTRSISGVKPVKEGIHITGKDASKKTALIKLIDILKLKPQEIIGIGDSYNDISFLEICGLKVAVKNAIKEVKEIADYVSTEDEDEGVIETIERFILKDNQ